MKKNESCKGCIQDLGGGCCRINVEAECREGGGFELYESEPKEVEAPRPHASRSEVVLKWGSIILMFIAYPLVLYKLWLWVKFLWEVYM